VVSPKFVAVRFSIVPTQAEEKADPSTSLRFGRDDIFQLVNFDSER